MMDPAIQEMASRLRTLGYETSVGVAQERLLEQFARLYLDEISHASRCPYRHSGPCMCIRSDLGSLLLEYEIDL